MRRLLPSGLTGAALAVALLIATASGTALAYFTTTGSGSTSAGISKLTAPTISAATPAAGGTVALTWGAVTPPGTGTVTYSVTRDGGAPAGNCPSSASPAAITTCTDSGVAIGTHSYVVTAKWRSWSAASSTSTAKITIGPVTHLDLKAASTTPTAGATNNLTITAQDANDATVTTYIGSHSLVFSGATASPGGNNPTVSSSSGSAVAFGSATAINFTAGVATVSSTKNGVMRLYRSGATTVAVSEGSISSSPDLNLTVSPATTSKISLGRHLDLPDRRRDEQPDDHRCRHLWQPRHLLHRLAQPHLLRGIGERRRQRAHRQQQLGDRCGLRQRHRDRVRRRRGERERRSQRSDDALQKRREQPQSERWLADQLGCLGHRHRRLGEPILALHLIDDPYRGQHEQPDDRPPSTPMATPPPPTPARATSPSPGHRRAPTRPRRRSSTAPARQPPSARRRRSTSAPASRPSHPPKTA